MDFGEPIEIDSLDHFQSNQRIENSIRLSAVERIEQEEATTRQILVSATRLCSLVGLANFLMKVIMFSK